MGILVDFRVKIRGKIKKKGEIFLEKILAEGGVNFLRNGEKRSVHLAK